MIAKKIQGLGEVLEIDKQDYDEVLEKLKQANVEIKTEVFEWVQWKSVL